MIFKYNHKSRDKGVNKTALNKDYKYMEDDSTKDRKNPRRIEYQVTSWITF